MSIVIIHGPQGCGKTRHASRFMDYFRSHRLVDDWDGRAPLRDGDLAITHIEPPFKVANAQVFDAESAKRMTGVRAPIH